MLYNSSHVILIQDLICPFPRFSWRGSRMSWRFLAGSSADRGIGWGHGFACLGFEVVAIRDRLQIHHRSHRSQLNFRFWLLIHHRHQGSPLSFQDRRSTQIFHRHCKNLLNLWDWLCGGSTIHFGDNIQDMNHPSPSLHNLNFFLQFSLSANNNSERCFSILLDLAPIPRCSPWIGGRDGKDSSSEARQ